MEELLKKWLQNSRVESFGMCYQVLTITFRSTGGDNYILSLLDTETESNIDEFDSFSDEEKSLLLFWKLNLSAISDLEIDANNTIKLYFDKIWIQFKGKKEYEIWQVGKDTKEDLELVIANIDGTFNVWDKS